jgi:multiple antibiotic resistance protein
MPVPPLDYHQMLNQAVLLWAIIDPIGTIPLFLSVTRGKTPAQQRAIALKAILIATGILITFIVAGQIFLNAMGIRMSSFQIAGGIVLFLFALTMIFEKNEKASDTDQNDVAVFPLAVPSIAGPAAMMGVVVLTDNDRFSIPQQAVTAGVMLIVLLVTYILLLLAGPIKRLIGDSGASIVSRVMGLVLAALAVETVIAGIKLL